MSHGSEIIPGEAVFSDFRRQCLATENWLNKYSKNGMEVWVEVPTLSNSPLGNKSNYSKVHKVKVRDDRIEPLGVGRFRLTSRLIRVSFVLFFVFLRLYNKWVIFVENQGFLHCSPAFKFFKILVSVNKAVSKNRHGVGVNCYSFIYTQGGFLKRTKIHIYKN